MVPEEGSTANATLALPIKTGTSMASIFIARCMESMGGKRNGTAAKVRWEGRELCK